MIDVQNQPDNRGIPIQQTGVSGVCLPFLIDNGGRTQQVQALVRFTVALNENLRGTHMSRLMEILDDWTNKPIAFRSLDYILREATEKLETNAAHIRLDFKYFVERKAPVSGRTSLLDVDSSFAASLVDGMTSFQLGLSVPFTTLCPCSREISTVGAHNQRSVCSVLLSFSGGPTITVDDLTALIEKQASSQIFPLLKREDEKFVTEAAYNNPKFVEDILRDVVTALRSIKGLRAFSVECENFESIHNHNAFALHDEIIGGSG